MTASPAGTAPEPLERQIAETIDEVFNKHGFTLLRISETAAGAVMAVVQPALDDKDDQIRELNEGYNAQVGHGRLHYLKAEAARAELDAANRALAAVRELAEAAEQEANRQRDSANHWKVMYEEEERENDRLQRLVGQYETPPKAPAPMFPAASPRSSAPAEAPTNPERGAE